MTITHQILGAAGRDNALWVQIDSGQSVERLLFDCGDGCLNELSFGDIQAVDQLFFSHLHMDHVGGFDTFFRCNYGRDSKPNQIWGPPETARILQHRFQGFLWNLNDEMAATWFVSDIHPGEIRTSRFELREAFATTYDAGVRPCERRICDSATYTVDAFTMDHRTPTIAYIVREKPRQNIDISRLASLGLRPGAWLKELKEAVGAETLSINGVEHSAAELRAKLVVETTGDSIAYLTDFLLDEAAMKRLAEPLRGCRVMICEGQYRHTDEALALKNHHMTTVRAATLAKRAAVEELTLFHLSDRYQRAEWEAMLDDARRIFPLTNFPSAWGLGRP